ncbi:MAG: helix-turn-helix domain-containing protein, partial [Candidatus Limnocylindrales bacterium]
MNDLQVGAVARAVRRRHGLRQCDVASRSGTSQVLVSLVELGRLEEVGLRTTRRVLTALGIQLQLDPRYRGAEAHRLLDSAHAAIVEAVVGWLAKWAWQPEPEYTFNHFGDRGSVDVLGTRPERHAVAIIEVKSRIVDVQDTLARLDRKVRVVPTVLRRERGRPIHHVGRILILPGTTANRTQLKRHAASFRAVLPGDSLETRAWLREPRGHFSGVWLIADTTMLGAK